MMNFEKYQRRPDVPLKERKWPSNKIENAPVWCSVDLRDGNQALEIPMNLEQKVDFFNYLVRIGFKQIEIGFPAASETDYNFTRYLIENDLIPDDVAIQVLTQSREHIIQKTMEAVAGAPKVIIHLYNATSYLQRNVVFEFGCDECIKLATDGAQLIKKYIEADNSDTEYILEYSPENFSETEPEFALKICDSVLDIWQPTPDKKAIINLPETVELTTPNIYADQIEYFCTNTKWRDSIYVSLHTHNDRGTGVAASELGLLAGADRVEGTLFGNGERTGNADIVILAINIMLQGVDPKLDFSSIDEAVEIYEKATSMIVDDRHPWAGKLVYSAFSGSHQNAIKKGMEHIKNTNSPKWEVPYLPIDPMDVGRNYEPIIRINSQSGKGGVSYILEHYYGLNVPKSFMINFLPIIKDETDRNQMELTPQQVFDIFDETYINVAAPYRLVSFSEIAHDDKHCEVAAKIMYRGEQRRIKGKGTGLLDAFVNAFTTAFDIDFTINMYNEHAMKSGTDSAAITYIEIKRDHDRNIYLGAGVSSSVTKSSVRAIISAVNRMIK